MNSALRIAFLTIPFAVGCAESETAPLPPPVRPFDSAGIDTSSRKDSSAVEDTADTTVEETSAPCIPLTTDKKPCGKCGTQTRVCSPSGTWGEYSSCGDEKTFTACSIGETQITDCGNCGKQTDTCDPMTCEWVTGSCSGEGMCAAGEAEEISASCTVVGEVRRRTCSEKCSWGPYSECSLPKGWIKMASAPTTVEGRVSHTAVWTGTDMIVWGGYGAYTSPSFSYYKRNGGSYNLAANSWKEIALPPTSVTARYGHTAVMSNTGKMIVFGGYDGSYKSDAAIYDPATNTWTLAATSPLSARNWHTAVWSTTTNEMIVWGGYGSSCPGSYCADGAAYDPVANTWTLLPAAPITGRQKHVMVWTGTELVIWGGQTSSSNYFRDGARFDPKTKVWTKFPDPPAEFDGRIDSAAVWSGKELIIWGGYGQYMAPAYVYGRSDGARYTPGGSWTRFTLASGDVFSTGSFASRWATQAWAAGGKMYVWSGAGSNTSSSSGTIQAGAATYDPSTDKWTTVDTTNAPTMRARATVVWTGKEAIIWGGASNSSATASSGHYTDGAIYRP